MSMATKDTRPAVMADKREPGVSRPAPSTLRHQKRVPEDVTLLRNAPYRRIGAANRCMGYMCASAQIAQLCAFLTRASSQCWMDERLCRQHCGQGQLQPVLAYLPA